MLQKPLTNTEIAELLSAKSGLTIEQVKTLLLAQAELAYSNATRGYPVPGIGVLTMSELPGRTGRNPATGQEITIPGKRIVKFQLARMAKELTVGRPGPMPDLFQLVQDAEFKFVTEAVESSDPAMFIADLGVPFTLADDGKSVLVKVYPLPDLRLPTGRIIAADPMIGGQAPFSRIVAPGSYPLALAIAQLGKVERVALAIVRFSSERIVKWEVATCEGAHGQSIGYGVDSGTGCFCDASVRQLIDEAYTGTGLWERICKEMNPTNEATRNWVHIDSPNGSLAVFSSGYGDDSYASYFGLDETGNPQALVTDFSVVNWGPKKNR